MSKRVKSALHSPTEQSATRSYLAYADHTLALEGLSRGEIGKKYDKALIEGRMTADEVVAR